MGTTIEDVFNNFSKLRVREQIPAIVQNNAYPLIVKIQGQHQQGLLGTGQKITPGYKSDYYAKFKASLNQAAGYAVPDIKVTGSYNDEMKLTVNGDEYNIDSDVSYAQSASITQYGSQLNLPTDESKNEYWNETLAPEILGYIKTETGL